MSYYEKYLKYKKKYLDAKNNIKGGSDNSVKEPINIDISSVHSYSELDKKNRDIIIKRNAPLYYNESAITGDEKRILISSREDTTIADLGLGLNDFISFNL